MKSKLAKFYVRCAPGHTNVSFMEISNLLKKLRGNATLEKERDLQISSTKNGLFLKTDTFRHGIEVAMRCLTIQDIEYVLLEENCKTKRDVKRRLKKIEFRNFIPAHSLSYPGFTNSFKLHSRANQSVVNSSKFLKEAFHAALQTSGVLIDSDGNDMPNKSSDEEFLQQFKHLNSIRISLIENKLNVSISLAGNMDLYKRAYKKIGGTATAPLPEHHASACILWSLHTMQHKLLATESQQSAKVEKINTPRLSINNIIVPFAGTGTLGFEGLLVMMESVGSGIFTDRRFPFDDFPIIADCSDLENCGDETLVGDSKKRISTRLRDIMRKEVAEKLLQRNYNTINDSIVGDNTISMPVLQPNARVLFTDINEGALQTCKDNIASFVHSSGNTFPKSLFVEPLRIDFLHDDVSDVIFHSTRDQFADNNTMSRISAQSYATGTTFLMLNPPFGLRLAKNSSTSSMYYHTAHQVCQMRDKLLSLKSAKLNDEADGLVHPCLAGLCLCPDTKSWSVFISTLSACSFECETTHFSLGGNDMRVVGFWDKDCSSKFGGI